MHNVARLLARQKHCQRCIIFFISFSNSINNVFNGNRQNTEGDICEEQYHINYWHNWILPQGKMFSEL